jgi:clan AA aspartic protease (TIGR02281 family)
MAKIRFDSSLPVIILDVTLQSSKARRHIRMALDTGATYTMIPWEIAEALGCRPELSKEVTSLITASGVERAPLVKIESMKVLGKEVKNAWVICHDLPQKSYVDGLLGLSSLKSLGMRVDFSDDTLELC